MGSRAGAVCQLTSRFVIVFPFDSELFELLVVPVGRFIQKGEDGVDYKETVIFGKVRVAKMTLLRRKKLASWSLV